MQILEDSKAVVFKCDSVYWNAVYDGVKTAELRLLSRSEWGDVLAHPPEQIWLLDLKSGRTLSKQLTWFSAVGEVVGSTYVLFCFKDLS